MRKYKAYEVTLFQYRYGYSAHWSIRDADTGYYHHHRVGGPAHGRYNSEGMFAQTWYLNGEEYRTEAEYQKALEKWLSDDDVQGV